MERIDSQIIWHISHNIPTWSAQYGDKMVTAYHRQDLIGWVARRVLQGPETIFEYHKDYPDAPASRRGRQLPPRLSLRAQASKRVSSVVFSEQLLYDSLSVWSSLTILCNN